MPTLKSYLKPVLTTKHTDLKLSDAAATDVDARIGRLIEVVAGDAGAYAAIAKRKTIMVRDAESALKMSTLKHAADKDPAFVETVLKTATSAVSAAAASAATAEKKTSGKSRSSRAGLAFPVSRIEAAVRRAAGPERRLGEHVGVFVTAVAEMAAAALLDGAGELAKAEGRKTVSPAHVAKAADDMAATWKLVSPLPAVGDAGQTAGDA